MKSSFLLSLIVSATVTVIAALATSVHVRGAGAEGKKCECFGGDATCFFDGSRCPVSGGKCKCFKSPVGGETPAAGCCCGGGQPCSAESENAAADFCSARCPEVVGGETCNAQCRLKSGHCGRHLCLKLHDF